jgi:acid phosphatase family membrane protein YuiD
VALKEGLASSSFGLAFILAAIVIYDRTKLFHMYAVFQGRFPGLAKEVERDPILQDLVGHTLAQVLVGILIGAAAAALTWHFTG